MFREEGIPDIRVPKAEVGKVLVFVKFKICRLLRSNHESEHGWSLVSTVQYLSGKNPIFMGVVYVLRWPLGVFI